MKNRRSIIFLGRAVIFGITYISIILLFSIIYYLIPNHFYYDLKAEEITTKQYESEIVSLMAYYVNNYYDEYYSVDFTKEHWKAQHEKYVHEILQTFEQSDFNLNTDEDYCRILSIDNPKLYWGTLYLENDSYVFKFAASAEAWSSYIDTDKLKTDGVQLDALNFRNYEVTYLKEDFRFFVNVIVPDYNRFEEAVYPTETFLSLEYTESNLGNTYLDGINLPKSLPIDFYSENSQETDLTRMRLESMLGEYYCMVNDIYSDNYVDVVFNQNLSTDAMYASDESNLFYNNANRYFRMLYMSMVTITTLGYGDIVPLSNTARILVGLEAVLGMLSLGGFTAYMFSSEQSDTDKGKK